MSPVVLHRYEAYRLANPPGLTVQEVGPESRAAAEIAELLADKKSTAFLQALGDPSPAPKPTAAPVEVTAPRVGTSRAGLKHVGGYFNREDVEKIAVLRARLGLDNSQLIRLAVDELFKKHSAQRAFGN